MPTCLFRPLNCSKSCKLILILLLFPSYFFGQTLTGLWTGALSNDSTTVRKDQSFEIALTEYRGKVYGYSRSEFIVDDTLYYVVKRVKGVIDGDICEVIDDEIIAYNFRGKLDKGIKVTSTFRRNQQDSTWYLAGTWKTNATKKYYSVTGRVDLSEEKDLAASKIFPHLEELNLADNVAFYKERKEKPSIARVIKPENIKTGYSSLAIELPDNKGLAVAKPDWQRAESKPVIEDYTVTKDNVAAIDASKTQAKNIPVTNVSLSPAKPAGMDEYSVITNDNIAPVNASKTEAKNIVSSTVTLTPSKPSGIDEYHVINNDNIKAVEVSKTTGGKIPDSKVSVSPSQPIITAANKKAIINPVAENDDRTLAPDILVTRTPAPNSNAASTKPQAVPSSITIAPNQKDIASNNTSSTRVSNEVKPADRKGTPVTVVPENKKPAIDITVQHAMIAGRKTEFSQIVNFKSDSIELSLYDNGEIDGDTVSIYYNGEVIMSRQGLKASAIKKTIYIKPGQDDFTLVLFAENLGKYPPNTGLLVVHDGNDVYNLRFSSDFQKNAGIVFRRKH